MDRVAARAELLVARCRERGITPTADGRVAEEAAAGLLGMEPGSLANQRRDGKGPEYFRLTAGNGSRVSYDILDLARWIEAFRTSPEGYASARDR